MGLGLGLRLWGSMVGHPSNSWVLVKIAALVFSIYEVGTTTN